MYRRTGIVVKRWASVGRRLLVGRYSFTAGKPTAGGDSYLRVMQAAFFGGVSGSRGANLGERENPTRVDSIGRKAQSESARDEPPQKIQPTRASQTEFRHILSIACKVANTYRGKEGERR